MGDDEEWAALCRVMGKAEMIADPRFATGLLRMKSHDELDRIISGWTKGVEKHQAMELLQNAGVPAGPVYDSQDTNLSPHYWATGFLEKVESSPERGMGTRVLMGRPYRLSKTPLRMKGFAPQLGDANHEFLVDVLGYSEDRYKDLQEAGIVGNRPTNPRPMPTMSLDDMVKMGRFKYHDPEYKRKLGI